MKIEMLSVGLGIPAFISHSASQAMLQRIFVELLPALDGKTVLDVGSRLGAVLYGAHAFSRAARIVGIEINADLAALSSAMVAKYRMQV